MPMRCVKRWLCELPGSHKGRAEVLKNFNQRPFLSLLEQFSLPEDDAQSPSLEAMSSTAA